MPGEHGKLERAVELLAASQTLSFVWADGGLVVTGTYGALAAGITIGAPLIRALPMLHGAEADVRSLAAAPAGALLEIPNVAWHRAGLDLPRLNVCVAWDAASGGYVVLIARALSRAALETELQQQVRARRLAETQLVEQAEAIRAANATLARINRDLGEFAHIVSHDLKAPMRALRYFADDLEQSLEDPATGDPHTHLASLRGQTRRMTGMLSGLLAYAKLDRKADAAEPTDVGAVAEEIVRSMPHPAGVAVEILGNWPTVIVVRALIDLVLRNLVENALKYARRPDSRVTLRCGRDGDVIRISVADNGPGIAPKHHMDVFRPFTQLEASDGETGDGGAGMGLALVKRAVEAAGATITVRSDPEIREGAEFQLVWPCLDTALSETHASEP